MNSSTLNTWQKWWFCFAAILLLYVSGIYVMDVIGQGQLSWRSLPVWLFKLLLNTVFAFGWFLFLEWALQQLKKRVEASRQKDKVIAYYLLGGVGMLAAGMLVMWLLQPLRHWFWTFQQDDPELNAFSTRAVFGLVACITMCGFIALANRQIWLNLEALRSKADRMEKENLQSQISALNNQVNPHFLFNSLSILSSLVRRDADRSEQFILQLSKAYHYILDRHETDTVPLREELDFLKAYAYLLETRFEGKFELRAQLDEATLQATRIAPLTLQLLVENAVKHNRMSEKEPLVIHIAAQDGMLQVRNRLRERGERQPSTGMGLQNIYNRYALLSERPVWAGERQGDWVVEVPML
jgi:hypothetical protein